MHRRRDFLGTLPAVVATIPGSAHRRLEHTRSDAIRLASVDQDPSPALPVVPSVSIRTHTETRGRPARITVSWRNESEMPVRLGEARSAFFARTVSDDEEAILLGDEWGSHGEMTSSDGCWQTTQPVNGDGAYRIVELEPGERHEAASGLYGYRESCLTSGTHTFLATVSTRRPDTPDGHGPSAEWGFALEVTADG